jgi:hypothetical protein
MCLLYMCPHTHMSPTYLSSYSYVSYICVLILIRLLHMCPHTHTSPTYLSSYSYVCYICVLTSLSVTAPDEGKRTGSHMSAIYVSSPAYQSRHQTRASALDLICLLYMCPHQPISHGTRRGQAHWITHQGTGDWVQKIFLGLSCQLVL